jgi:hypothetical protein
LLQKIKEAFVKEYVTPNGRLISGTQTAYVLALNFEMLPESQRADAAKQLADKREKLWQSSYDRFSWHTLFMSCAHAFWI